MRPSCNLRHQTPPFPWLGLDWWRSLRPQGSVTGQTQNLLSRYCNRPYDQRALCGLECISSKGGRESLKAHGRRRERPFRAGSSECQIPLFPDAAAGLWVWAGGSLKRERPPADVQPPTHQDHKVLKAITGNPRPRVTHENLGKMGNVRPEASGRPRSTFGSNA
jgi:hypothetical protein